MSYGEMELETNGGKYLKIKMGSPVDIHILTRSENIKKRYVHYDGQKYSDCIANACDQCDQGLKKETRTIIHVLDRADQVVKKFEFGMNIAIGIKEIAKVLEMDGSDIHSVDIRISRISDKPVRYQVVQRKMAAPISREMIEAANLPF